MKNEIPQLKQGEIKQRYLIYIGNDKENDACELLVSEILGHYKIFSTREDVKSEMWIYVDGIYIPNGKSYVKEILRSILEEWFGTRICNKVIARIEADTFIDSNEFFNVRYQNEIAVKNGILNLETREISPFTPDKIFFFKMPVIYDSSKRCPYIEKHFEEVLKKSQDKQVLYEIIGYCLDKTHFIEKAFMFVGDGRNGKGKTLELIKRFMGAEACCSVPISSMKEDSFNLHQMFGKSVNLAGDLNNTDLKNTGLFKSLTGRDLITAHRKFMTDINFTSFAKNIFACNELPKVYDMSKGFWSRWVLLEFPYEFIKKEDYEKLSEPEREFKKIIDVNHIDKITTSGELSGLLNKALDGLDTLRKNKDFSYTTGSQEIKDFWIRKSNSFLAFCYDCVKEDENGFITKRDLRKHFSKYCKSLKLKGAGDTEIKANLEDLYGVIDSRKVVNGEQEHVWVGINCHDIHTFLTYRKFDENSLKGKTPGNAGKSNISNKLEVDLDDLIE